MSVPSWMRLGLRQRLTLITIVPAFLMIGIAGLGLVQYANTSHRAENRDAALTMLETLSSTCSQAAAVHALDRIDSQLMVYAGRHSRGLSVMAVAMFDWQGGELGNSARGRFFPPKAKMLHDTKRIEAFMGRAMTSSVPIWAQYRAATDELVLLVATPSVAGLRWGTVVGAFDQTEMEAGIVDFVHIVVVIALFIFLIMQVSLRIALARVVMQPLNSLVDTAQTLRDGRLDARSSLPGGDELGELGNSLNAMAMELSEYTAGLEAKVEARSSELAAKNTELEVANVELERLAITDPLTGAFNRRRLMEQLDIEERRAQRQPLPLSVLMIDFDHFKQLNDTAGHDTGDQVLKQIVTIIDGLLRDTDMLARYGGEEFVVLLLNCTETTALVAAERIRAAVAETVFPGGENQPGGRLTVSIGVACALRDDYDSLISRADVALYQAKGAGRNRIVATPLCQ